MSFFRRKYEGFLGLGNSRKPSPRSYKSAALPTELRQPCPRSSIFPTTAPESQISAAEKGGNSSQRVLGMQ
jgi:hypothetical protein